MPDEKKKMKILIIPKACVDVENVSTTGLARKMIEKGHRVRFIISDMNKAYDKLGFDYEVLGKEIHTSSGAQTQPKGNPTQPETQVTPQNQIQDQNPAINAVNDVKPNQNLISNWFSFAKNYVQYVKTQLLFLENKNGQLEKVIARYDPDVFVTDDYFEYFSVSKTDKPWVWLFNGNPLTILRDTNLPPPYSGLPSEKPTFMWFLNRLFYDLCVRFVRYLVNVGLNTYGKPFRLIEDGSPYLNLFSYPKELDYQNRKQWKQNYYRVDSFMVKDTRFKIPDMKIPPEKLMNKDKQKRVVMVSMGNTHWINSLFMKKLLTVLSKTPHLYLISKENSSTTEDYQLSENMWSDSMFSSLQLIEKSEVVITDGSNETVTEAFAMGKPMIVIPMWLAQLDNAQRVDETGYGIRLSPWSFTEKELIDAIEKLLDDKELKLKLTTASNRIWEENRLDKAIELIDNLGRDRWFYRSD